MRTVNDDIVKVLNTIGELNEFSRIDTNLIEESILLYHIDGEDIPQWIEDGIADLEMRSRFSSMLIDAVKKFTEERDRMNRSA